MTSESAAPGISVPWDKLIGWINEQLMIEQQTGRPAPLSRLQLEAISQLIPLSNEPDVSSVDHVSLLMQKVQAHRLPTPVFVDTVPVNVPVGGGFQPRWRCVCTMDTFGVFPREEYGFDSGQEPPHFQTKKNAKQYAAKHALAFLSENLKKPGFLARKPRQPASQLPMPLQPPNIRSNSHPTLSPGHSARVSPRPSPRLQQQTSTGSSPRATPSSEKNSPVPSIYEQVSSLSRRLGFDNPSYKIDQDPERPDLFCGRPFFKNCGRIPPELGVVIGAASSKEAKQQVAELLVVWLQAELQKRQDVYESLWSAPTTPKPLSPNPVSQ